MQRIQEVYDLKQYQEIYAYGDSQGDKEMLKLPHIHFLDILNRKSVALKVVLKI